MDDVEAHLTGGYEAFNRRDFAHLEAMMAPQFVWNEAPEVPGRKVCNSRDEFAEYMRGFDRLWDGFTWEPLGYEIAGPGTVIAKVCGRGVGRASGTPIELVIHHVWRFDGDDIVRMDAFLDEAEAREHAGL